MDDKRKLSALQAAENRRIAPAMRALKALHSAGTPEEMTHEKLERQRRNQEILGRLAAPMSGMDWEEFHIAAMPAAWMRLKSPMATATPFSTATAAATPAATWGIPGCWPPSSPPPPATMF